MEPTDASGSGTVVEDAEGEDGTVPSARSTDATAVGMVDCWTCRLISLFTEGGVTRLIQTASAIAHKVSTAPAETHDFRFIRIWSLLLAACSISYVAAGAATVVSVGVFSALPDAAAWGSGIPSHLSSHLLIRSSGRCAAVH